MRELAGTRETDGGWRTAVEPSGGRTQRCVLGAGADLVRIRHADAMVPVRVQVKVHDRGYRRHGRQRVWRARGLLRNRDLIILFNLNFACSEKNFLSIIFFYLKRKINCMYVFC